MFLLVSVRHVGAHPDELQHGVSIQSSINLGKTFPRICRIRIILSTQILARVFVYLPPFIPQILDFICRMVLIFILIYFEWRDTENQQYVEFTYLCHLGKSNLEHLHFLRELCRDVRVKNAVVEQQFQWPLSTRYLRFNPTDQVGWNCLSLKLYGTAPRK